MMNWIKKYIRHWLLCKRFPKSIIHYGAVADKKSVLGQYAVLFSNAVLQNTTLGNYSYVQNHTVLINSSIGRFCSIAANVNVGLASHPLDRVSTNPVFYDNTQPLPFFFTNKVQYKEKELKTNISADVWIGQGAMVKSGINIGVGAVIGAGAIVTHDVEPYSIVAGIPAKHIKWRFDTVIREQLIQSKWWELSDKQLAQLAPKFNNPEEMLKMMAQNFRGKQ